MLYFYLSQIIYTDDAELWKQIPECSWMSLGSCIKEHGWQFFTARCLISLFCQFWNYFLFGHWLFLVLFTFFKIAISVCADFRYLQQSRKLNLFVFKKITSQQLLWLLNFQDWIIRTDARADWKLSIFRLFLAIFFCTYSRKKH